MVIDHVEDDGDASFVERLHHLLELQDATDGIIGVGGIAAFGHVVVHRVVAPVVLGLVEARLINGAEVIARQDMDGIDAQRLQVVDGPRFGEGEELTRILRIGTGNGEVTVVHLIDNEVGGRLDDGVLVITPTVGTRLRIVDDGGTTAIHSHGLGKDTRCLAMSGVESVVAA